MDVAWQIWAWGVGLKFTERFRPWSQKVGFRRFQQVREWSRLTYFCKTVGETALQPQTECAKV